MNLSKRDVDGFLLMDKPKNVSSSFVLNEIKRYFCANKAGHTGTLDVLATGMLPIFFGKATKLAKYLLNSDKKYRAEVKLGVSTNTFDSCGEIISMIPVTTVIMNTLEQCLNSFKGRSYQIPPMFSAIKYRGVPLYKYARKNINIPRYAREICVYDLCLLSVKEMNIIELYIHCSKGTYVRSIVNDLGTCLGCGAHVIGLRRLAVGKFLSTSMIQFEVLKNIFNNKLFNKEEMLRTLDALLLPIEIIEFFYYNN